MNEWLKVNAPLIAATMLLLSVLTLMRWELTARIETAEARMNTIRVEILAKLELLQKQFDTLQRQIESYLNKNIELEVQTRDNTRRIDKLEKRIETR